MLNYFHFNPVTAGFVNDPWHWKYSSAVDYMPKDKACLTRVFRVNDAGGSSNASGNTLKDQRLWKEYLFRNMRNAKLQYI